MNNDDPNNSGMRTFSYFDKDNSSKGTKPFSETYTEGLNVVIGSNQTLKQKITSNTTNREGTYLKTIPGFTTSNNITQERVPQVNNFFGTGNSSAGGISGINNNGNNYNTNFYSNSNNFIKKSGPIRAFNYEIKDSNQKKSKANNSNGFQTTTVITFPENVGSDYDSFKKGRPSTAPLKGKKIKAIANQNLQREAQRNSSLPPSKPQETSKTKMRSSSPGYNKIKENNAAFTNTIKPSWVF